PAEAAAKADVVFVFVVNAQQAQSVLFGTRGAVSAAPLGTVFVICATIPPAEAERLAADLTAAGMGVLDAPVSGGAAKAEMGEMTIIASGASAAFDKAGPALDAISTQVFRLGEAPGAGSKVKMINQLLAGVHIAAMAEAMVLAKREGLDLQTVYDVIRVSAGSSWMFENRGPQVVGGDYTPYSAVDIFVKDLGIVTQTAGEVELPLTGAALALFEEASAAGLGREADAAVAKTLAQKSGVDL
ncbi:MAG: NAD-binding protein, partial [Pseudomonadota bacterium]